MNQIIITMKVRNHPGVMSHIAGLFSRRIVNIDEIAVRKVSDEESAMILHVQRSGRAMTVIRQLADHYDVLSLDWEDFEGESIFPGEDIILRRR